MLRCAGTARRAVHQQQQKQHQQKPNRGAAATVRILRSTVPLKVVAIEADNSNRPIRPLADSRKKIKCVCVCPHKKNEELAWTGAI